MDGPPACCKTRSFAERTSPGNVRLEVQAIGGLPGLLPRPLQALQNRLARRILQILQFFRYFPAVRRLGRRAIRNRSAANWLYAGRARPGVRGKAAGAVAEQSSRQIARALSGEGSGWVGFLSTHAPAVGIETIRERSDFVFELAEEGLVLHDLLDAALHIARVRLREVLAVPVDLAFGNFLDFPAAHEDRIRLDDIEEIRRLAEHAGRFLKDAHHPAVFDAAGDIANGIFQSL